MNMIVHVLLTAPHKNCERGNFKMKFHSITALKLTDLSKELPQIWEN